MNKRLFSTILACVLAIGAFAACKNTPAAGDMTVYMPDGAPAIALAGMMKDDTENDGVSYRVVDPNLIAKKVTYADMDENADLCVLPLTAATKLLGSGEKYKMLGAVTHGNLYIISKDGSLSYTIENLAALKGKTVGVLQLASTPGLIFKTILKKHNVAYAELSGGVSASAEAVNLQAIASAKEIPTLVQSGVETFVLAEPAVTVQSKNGFYRVGDLQALYGGENGYPQAVLVAKNTLVAEKGDWLSGFLDELAESAAWALTASSADIVSAVTAHLEDSNYSTALSVNNLSTEVVARCGVRFEASSVCKAAATAFLQAANTVDSKLAVLPSEDFYWLG